MNKTEAIVALIKDLTELELAEVLEGINEHIEKENKEHLIDNVFGDSGYESDIDALNEELDESEKQISDLEDRCFELESAIEKVLEDHEEELSALGVYDKLKSAL